jgi:uncharacterized protein YbbC (DUF1343 family)
MFKKVSHILLLAVLASFSCADAQQSSVVKTGIEVLTEQDFEPLKGKKVGLITNATGVDRNAQFLKSQRKLNNLFRKTFKPKVKLQA